MKSLEFANEYRNITVKSMNEYIDNCDKYGQEINECYFNILEEQLAHFDIIKQDLEVLELIKKHLEVYIWQNIFSKEHELEIDIILKHIDNEEERYKVKQWLEVNENGR